MIKMKENIKIQPSGELAYWIGLVQADGSLKHYKFKRNGKVKERWQLDLESKDKVLIEKFKSVNKNIFKRSSKMWRRRKGTWTSHIGVKRLLLSFQSLDINFSDPPMPPKWCTRDLKFFGTYLAG